MNENRGGPNKTHLLLVSGQLRYAVKFRGSLIREFVRQGLRVTVASPVDDDSTGELAVELAEMGAELLPTKLSRTGLNPVHDTADIIELSRWIRSHKPDKVFALAAKPILVGISAAILGGVSGRYAMLAGLGYAFVDSGEGSLKKRLVRSGQLLAYRMLLRRCRAVIFHNSDDKVLLVRRGVVREDQTRVVAGSGVDLARFRPSVPPVEPVRFLFLGRLLKSKGIMELLEAMRRIRNRYPAVELHLAGATDPNPEAVDPAVLQQYIDEGLVVHHGHVENVVPLLEQTSVYVLPSYREGLPLSVLEALSSGRTAIVTDVPGCRDVVQPGVYGALVPVRDSQALAAAMVAYIEEPTRIVKEGIAARVAAEERFDVKQVNRAMLTALEITPVGALRDDP